MLEILIQQIKTKKFAYADDITVILDSNEKVNEIGQIFEQFEASSITVGM
jgi:hypothetical protein